MSKKWVFIVVILGLALTAVGFAKISSAKQNGQDVEIINSEDKQNLKPKDLERNNSDGAVQTGIIFANPLGQGREGYLTFVVQMDNHSHDLDRYDLGEFVILVDDKGNSPNGDVVWEKYSGGGHHLISYLLFPEDDFITSDTEYINLIIKDFIGVPERTFKWEKKFFNIEE